MLRNGRQLAAAHNVVPAHPQRSPRGAAAPAGGAPPEAVCRATVAVLPLWLGLVLPTILAVYCHHPAPAEEQAPAPVNGGAGQGLQRLAAPPPATRAARGPRSAVAVLALWSRLCAVVSQAASVSDSVLRRLLNNQLFPGARCLLCWWLFGYCWLWCRLVAGL